MQRLTITIVISFLATVWAIGAKANLLDYSSYAYIDATNRVWYGQTNYNSAPLSGSVEWVVFAPGKFNLAFPSSPYQPPSNELVYAYQIDNVGSSDASTLDVAIVAGRPADSIGYFPLTYSGTNNGIAPTSSSFVPSSPFVLAHWFKQGGILAGQSSSGLAYASPNVPEDEFGSLINSGAGADADPLPSPSTVIVPTPEPGAMTLALVATVLIGTHCRLRRKSS
jgi:hypothetical protein